MTAEAPIPGGPGWHIDPGTLRPVLTDEATFRTANATDPALDVLVALWSGDSERAARLIRPLLDAEPDSWRFQALAADVSCARGDTTSAIEALEQLLRRYRHTPREAVLHQHLGKAYYSQGDYPRAAACFREALSQRVRAEAPPDLLASSQAALDAALARTARSSPRTCCPPPSPASPPRPPATITASRNAVGNLSSNR